MGAISCLFDPKMVVLDTENRIYKADTCTTASSFPFMRNLPPDNSSSTFHSTTHFNSHWLSNHLGGFNSSQKAFSTVW